MSYLYAGTIRNWQGMAQTSTALTVYTDAAGTSEADLTDSGGTPIANPTTADDRGRVEVYSSAPTLYYKVTGDSRVMRLVRFCDLTQSQVSGLPFFNALDYGVVANGTHDDTTYVNDLIEEVAAADYGGTIYLPQGRVKVTDSIIPGNNVNIIGGGTMACTDSAQEGRPGTTIVGEDGFPIIGDGGVVTSGFGLHSLAFVGAPTEAGSRGIYVGGGSGIAQFWTLRDLFFKDFADQGVFIRKGAGHFENIWVQGACSLRANHSVPVGGFQLGNNSWEVSDTYCEHIVSTCSFPDTLGGYGSGLHCGILLNVSGCSFNWCVGHMSEVGIRMGPTQSSASTLNCCRADLNQGNGFEIETVGVTLTGCQSWRNGRDADATHYGFKFTHGDNTVIGCRVDGVVSEVQVLYGFVDLNGDGLPNRFIGNSQNEALISGSLYNTQYAATMPAVLEAVGSKWQLGAYSGNGLVVGPGGPTMMSGALNPSAGAGVPAVQGSIFMRTDGGASTSIYIKTGAGDTAWTAK